MASLIPTVFSLSRHEASHEFPTLLSFCKATVVQVLTVEITTETLINALCGVQKWRWDANAQWSSENVLALLLHHYSTKRSNPNNVHAYALRGSAIVVERLDGYLCLVQPGRMLMLTEVWKRFSESEGESVRAANSEVPQAIVAITQLF